MKPYNCVQPNDYGQKIQAYIENMVLIIIKRLEINLILALNTP